MGKIMNFLKNKIIIISMIIGIVLVVMLVVLLNNEDNSEFKLDPIYDVYPYG